MLWKWKSLNCVQLFVTPNYTVHGILQTRILEWVAFPFSRGIFPTQELNPGLLHCRQILYQLSHKGNQGILEWVACPFSSGSSWPRKWTGISCIAGGFFTNWATKEALCLLHIVSVKHFSFYLFFLPSLPPLLFTFSNLQKSKNYFQLQISRSVVSDSLRPHELQHARPPCPSPTPRVHPNPCPSRQWCHPTISSSVVAFSSYLQSFPASGSFPMSQLFAWGGQSTGVSALASVLPRNTQDWAALGWTGGISLQPKGLSRVFSNTIVQKHQFFSAQFLNSPTLTSIGY